MFEPPEQHRNPHDTGTSPAFRLLMRLPTLIGHGCVALHVRVAVTKKTLRGFAGDTAWRIQAVPPGYPCDVAWPILMW